MIKKIIKAINKKEINGRSFYEAFGVKLKSYVGKIKHIYEYV